MPEPIPALKAAFEKAAALDERTQKSLARHINLLASEAEISSRRKQTHGSETDFAALRLIRLILLVDWDPIGILEYPGADSEYDSYVGGVFDRLKEGGDASKIAAYLRQIEEQEMVRGLRSESIRAPRRAYAAQKIVRRYASLIGDADQIEAVRNETLAP